MGQGFDDNYEKKKKKIEFEAWEFMRYDRPGFG